VFVMMMYISVLSCSICYYCLSRVGLSVKVVVVMMMSMLFCIVKKLSSCISCMFSVLLFVVVVSISWRMRFVVVMSVRVLCYV